MKTLGKCEKCKRNLVELNNGNVVCGCTDKAVDEMLRMWAERINQRKTAEIARKILTEDVMKQNFNEKKKANERAD